ncbi:MAG: hypothetical protein ACREML_01890 [Vulcanimicrobiaceae bacterium]
MNLHPKVAAALGSMLTIGTPVTVVTVWILSLHGITVPDYVGTAIGAIINSFVGAVAGYLAPQQKVT